MDEMTLTLNSPLTEGDWDVITDVDFDRTNNVWFHTKHGKDVEFVKVVRCRDCIYYKDARINIFTEHDRCCKYVLNNSYYREPDEYCSKGKRREDGDNDDAID